VQEGARRVGVTLPNNGFLIEPCGPTQQTAIRWVRLLDQPPQALLDARTAIGVTNQPENFQTMAWTTLISVDELAESIDRCVVVDTRYDLMQPDAGEKAYAHAHLPGAHYLHLEHDLASPKGDGQRGRHPLPDRSTLAKRLGGIGLDRGRQLVAYDAHGGFFAARLWWLARWLGHQEVAVLDGGLGAWSAAGYPLSSDPPQPKAGDFEAGDPVMASVELTDVMTNLSSRSRLVVDARAPERYRGDVEPLDPVAGHIPGAVNRPTGMNLRPDGRFKPAPVLLAEFKTLLGTQPATQIIHSCGSGVSACHNVLAMEIAGLSGSAIFPGSWSQWCAEPTRPVATGKD
jgi:thiosulfate/3-mercaptopyruvate sulfurtransferase